MNFCYLFKKIVVHFMIFERNTVGLYYPCRKCARFYDLFVANGSFISAGSEERDS